MKFRNYGPLILLTLALSLGSHTMEEIVESQQERYDRAVSLKKGDGEDSAQAEALFLGLAEQGHAKAAHNYALLQVKKKQYQLAYDWFLKAGLDESKRNGETLITDKKAKPHLHLVLGSTRETGSLGSFLDTLYNAKLVDLSHTKTFGGRATTMDLRPCSRPKVPHIKGNAATYDFAKKWVIKEAFFERLETIPAWTPPSGTLSQDPHTAAQENQIGACLNQIAKAMAPGAPLHMEWHPCSTMMIASSSEATACMRENPFHGYFSLPIFVQAINSLVGEKTEFRNCPVQPSKEEAQELMSQITAALEFFHSHGITESIADMKQRLSLELKMINILQSSQQPMILDILPEGTTLDMLRKAIQTAVPLNLPVEALGQPILFKSKTGGKPLQGIAHDRQSFEANAFFTILKSEVAAQMNRPYVIAYLTRRGFKEISIERGTNPHNGRNNVWMIRATRA